MRLDDYKQVARLLESHGKVDYFNMWQGIVPSPRSGRTHWPAHYYRPRRVRAPAAGHQGVRVPAGRRGRTPRFSRRRRAVHRRRHRGSRRDGARPHCRPTPPEQGPRGTHRRHPHLHRLYAELRRTHLRRDGGGVHLQPGDGPRGRMGGASAGCRTAQGRGGRRRTGGHGVGTHRGGARTRRRPVRAWSAARRPGEPGDANPGPGQLRGDHPVLRAPAREARRGRAAAHGCGGRRHPGRAARRGRGGDGVERVPARGHRQRQAPRADRARGDPGQRRDRGERAGGRHARPGGGPHRRRAHRGHGPQGRDRHRSRLRRLRDAGAGLAQPDGAPAPRRT